MASIYNDFLTSPSTNLLAPDASLTYITTTTIIKEPAAIAKHFQAQAKQLKKTDKILHAIEGANGICIETETTIKFIAGGGAYLPGVDDNLLDEKIVLLPIVHVVTFDSQQRIAQIRLYWEQGTLLKQVEAIGRNGRNWPIRDGQALVETVKSSVKAAGQDPSSNGAKSTLPVREATRTESVSATRDPHASLQLFSPRDANTEGRSAYDGPVIAPRASARPPPRDYSELFVDGEQSPSAKRSTSPSKVDGRTLKANASKKFVANRLFDENVPLEGPQSPEKGKKTYGQKYDHFAFGDGEDVARARTSSKGSKAMEHFSFEDFATPPKASDKGRPDQERHWGAGVDKDDPARSPERREVVHKPRPDAESHFQLADDSPAWPAEKRRPTTNVDSSRRGQDFGAHYEISDQSPAGAKPEKPKTAARTELEPHWGFGTPPPEKKIYKTAGDGMGGRGARSWGFGDESDPEAQEEIRKSARSRNAQTGAGAQS